MPSVSCDPGYLGPDRPDYLPTTPARLHVWKARTKGYAKDCAKDAPALFKPAKHPDGTVVRRGCVAGDPRRCGAVR